MRPTYIRPPFASLNQPVLDLLGQRNYTAVLWSQDTQDWARKCIYLYTGQKKKYKSCHWLLTHLHCVILECNNKHLDPDDFSASYQLYEQLFNNTETLGQPGHIVLQHEVNQVTALQVAPMAIDLALVKGYRVVTVGECLGDPKSNWYTTRVIDTPI